MRGIWVGRATVLGFGVILGMRGDGSAALVLGSGPFPGVAISVVDTIPVYISPPQTI